MNKRIISLVTILSIFLTLLSLPVAATGTGVTAVYSGGIVTVNGTGFSSNAGYTVRIVDKVSSSIKAMGQVTADGSGSFFASVTTGELGELEAYKVYVNNSSGKLAGSSGVTIEQNDKTFIVTVLAGSNGSVTPPAQTVKAGGNAVFIITPDQGYEVDAVSSGEYDAANNTLTIFNVQEDMEIQITFKPVKVASVSLNRTTAVIEVNDSVTLVATVMPENAKNKGVTWSSGDTSIAAVANGVVTGVRAGTAVITATTVDGGKTATCSVFVKGKVNDDKDKDKDKDKDEDDSVITTPPSGPDEQISGQTSPQLAIVSIDTSAVVVTQSGNIAAVSVQEDDILAAAKAAQQLAAATAAAPMVAINLQLPENVSQVTVQLPGTALAGLAGSGVGLQINTGIASIQLSPEILGSLSSSGVVSLSIRRADPEKEIKTLPEEMRPAGGGIDLELGLDSSNANGSIVIEISVGADVDRDLVGLYYLNESTGELIFIGGKMEGSILQGETTHNSKYFVMEYKKQYKDTIPDSWYSKYVDSMTAKHIMSGYPSGIFNGSAYITRGEFAAALAKALGLAPVSYKAQFKDINTEAYYAEAAQSLYEAGIMAGAGNAHFKPETAITREEIFAIIGRIAGESSANTEILKKYTDAGELSAWAVDGAVKAVTGKIIVGEGNRLNPKSRLSRYEAAAILYRLYNR